jgi:hypothetical protein
MIEKVVILTLFEKMVLWVALLFYLGVDFHVFNAKKWVFGPNFSFLGSSSR